MSMKKIVLLYVWAAMMLTGCWSSFQTASVGGDLYSIHNRTEIAQRQKAEAEAARAEAEARQAVLEAKIAEARAAAAAHDYAVYTDGSNLNPYDLVLADSYESAYARRLFGFESPSYRMPSSYYTYRYSDAYHYASAYDPAFYNVMVSGDQIWVEPKYITSMFGTWGASVALPTYSWYYGWDAPYSSWWYGYPRYSWYDWNWRCSWWGYNYGWGYGPYWSIGFGYYPYHHHHYHPHYPGHYPSHGVPPHYGGDGGSHSRPKVVRRHVGQSLGSQTGGSRYPQQGVGTSGTSGGRTIRRVGGTVTGSGQYRGTVSGSSSRGTQYRGSSSGMQYRGSTGTRTSNSFNNRSESNSMSHSGVNMNRGSYSGGGGYSGGGNSSGGSHGGGQIRR